MFHKIVYVFTYVKINVTSQVQCWKGVSPAEFMHFYLNLSPDISAVDSLLLSFRIHDLCFFPKQFALNMRKG